jgi:NAD(P)-dependent dehydrogenase (short-subunit alcohol dehydrogenase family)
LRGQAHTGGEERENGMRDFNGRVAVITGAARGLGRAFADMAAARGMRLVLADLDADALERAAEELMAGGAEVLAMVCDVRKCSHVEELADAAMIRFHGVHLLFNNDCAGADGRSWEISEADWERVLGVNLWGVIHGVRIFTPLMLDCARRDPSYRGHIVNTASMAGQGAVKVARHAVLALTETLHQELRDSGAPIGASVLCPEELPMDAPADIAGIAFDTIRSGALHIVRPDVPRQGA